MSQRTYVDVSDPSPMLAIHEVSRQKEPDVAITHMYGFKTHVMKRQKLEGICGNKNFLKTHCLS